MLERLPQHWARKITSWAKRASGMEEDLIGTPQHPSEPTILLTSKENKY
jgi:hypothetical protein